MLLSFIKQVADYELNLIYECQLRSPRKTILCKHISQARHNFVMLKLIYVIAIIYYVSIFASSNCLTHSYFTDIDQLNASTNLQVPLAHLDAGLN